MKQWISAWLGVFFAWAVLDLIGHGLIFGSLYAAMPGVWRPQAEIKIGVIYAGVLTTAGAFVALYKLQIQSRGLVAGLLYGLLFGLANGASVACGGYAVHPIQAELALGWFILALVEGSVAGLIVGRIIRKPKAA
ncbi:MAG: hypothetical protein JSS49_15295 [Planctomycetes bacterium]|nr:hypothetical protein [Planctomycetota bacterium]